MINGYSKTMQENQHKIMMAIRMFGILVLIGGIFFTAFMIVDNTRIENDKLNHYIQCPAVIKEYIRSGSKSTKTSVLHERAKVTYEVAGQVYEARVYLKNGTEKIGETVYVYYDPDDPSKLAEVSGTQNRTRMLTAGIIACIVGMILIVMSFIFKSLNWQVYQ